MIKTRQDLRFFLEQDRIALSKPEYKGLRVLKEFLFPDEIWKYERLLRYAEYYNNVKHKNMYVRALSLLYRLRLHNQAVKLGVSIPLNVCDCGLSIAHYGTIVISANAHIGKNCHIHAGVNIGASAGKPDAPIIGDNVYIGPGAILFGRIAIADNVTVGANATVNRSCEEEHVVIAGTPATIVKRDFPNWLEFNKICVK